MPLDQNQEWELTGGGDTMLHYHLSDRILAPVPYGSFYDTTTQSIISTTAAYAMTFNTTVVARDVSIVSNSRLTFAAAGIYNIQFSAQLENSDTVEHDADIWLSQNGTNVTESNSTVGVPAKHGGINGHHIASWNFVVHIERNDYLQLYWSAASTLVSIPHAGVKTNPTRPSTPSIILTATFVSV